MIFNSFVQNTALHVQTKALIRLYIRLLHVWCMNSKTRGAPTAQHCRCWCRRTTMHTHTNIRQPKSDVHLVVGGVVCMQSVTVTDWWRLYFTRFSVDPKRTIRITPIDFQCHQAASFRRPKHTHGNQHFKADATS